MSCGLLSANGTSGICTCATLSASLSQLMSSGTEEYFLENHSAKKFFAIIHLFFYHGNPPASTWTSTSSSWHLFNQRFQDSPSPWDCSLVWSLRSGWRAHRWKQKPWTSRRRPERRHTSGMEFDKWSRAPGAWMSLFFVVTKSIGSVAFLPTCCPHRMIIHLLCRA